MSTIEEIYSALVKEGVRRKLTVVPEFCVSSRDHLFDKKIDVAWLKPRDESARFRSLRRWKIIAAFEIEGYDVPLERLRLHSSQFRQLWAEEGERFPCLVPLYTRAYHRTDAVWGTDRPDRKIEQRTREAQRLGEIIHIRDGRALGWVRGPLP